MKKIVLLLLILVTLYGCKPVNLPAQKFNASPIGYGQKIIGDSLFICVENHLECPIRVVLNDASLNKNFEKNGLFILDKKEKKSIAIFLSGKKEYKSGINYMLGKPIDYPEIGKLCLPFSEGKEYSIIQGYNGSFSHQTGLAKYALDFSLKIGDTVCAADEGYVVGIVDKYTKSGTSNLWKDYSNFLTIYNPKTALFTEYAHLKENGVLVSIGDFVQMGKPIARSGMTGWTTIAHLHFVAYFRDKNWNSQPVKIEFLENYIGEDLNKNYIVKKFTH